MRIRISFIVIFLLSVNFLIAQKLTNSDYTAYTNKYKSTAIREMQLFQIPASITLAQGMLESGCGKSKLALETNNHFGIKCQSDWTGDTYLYDDDKEKECFRKYNNVDESFRDHSLFLTTRKRYSQLFDLKITDYKGWANGLKQAGYATNPDYPNILIRLIENNKLYLLDDTSFSKKGKVVLSSSEDNEDHTQIIPGNNEKDTKAKVVNEGRIIFRKSYTMPVPAEYEYIYTSDEGRKVYQNYGVPFIFAHKGDTWYTIAKEFGIFSYQVYKQNDLLENDPITIGQMIYLENKKKNPERTYKVEKGDSMYSISQEKCIILSRLLKYNKLKPCDEPETGFELKLKRQSIF